MIEVDGVLESIKECKKLRHIQAQLWIAEAKPNWRGVMRRIGELSVFMTYCGFRFNHLDTNRLIFDYKRGNGIIRKEI